MTKEGGEVAWVGGSHKEGRGEGWLAWVGEAIKGGDGVGGGGAMGGASNTRCGGAAADRQQCI